MNTAQNDDAIPIKAIKLSPSSKLLKSNKVTLKTINANARKTSIEVKIFIVVGNIGIGRQFKEIELHK